MKRQILVFSALVLLSAAPALSSGDMPPSTSSTNTGNGSDTWSQVDKTTEAMHRHNQHFHEANREEILTEHGHHHAEATSAGDREANRQHFLHANLVAEERLTKETHAQQALVNHLLDLYQQHPSPGLRDSIKANGQKLSELRGELAQTRAFIARNKGK